MKITRDKTKNSRIEIVSLYGNLEDEGALDLRNYLFAGLDKRRMYQLFDLQHVKKIDALGIQILSYFAHRGIMIGLFHVEAEIRMMLRVSGKEDIINIYNEIDRDKVISRFESDVLKAKGKHEKSIENRRYQRVAVNFPTAFNYYQNHNDLILGRAKVVNISEGGLLVHHIVAMSKNSGQMLSRPDIYGKEFFYLNFLLNGKPNNVVETKGKCVREFRSGETLAAGICFKDMSQDSKAMVRNLVNNEPLST